MYAENPRAVIVDSFCGLIRLTNADQWTGIRATLIGALVGALVWEVTVFSLTGINGFYVYENYKKRISPTI